MEDKNMKENQRKQIDYEIIIMTETLWPIRLYQIVEEQIAIS